MGSGNWNQETFTAFCAQRGRDVNPIHRLSIEDVCKASALRSCMNPRGVIRECCENGEHPDTLPVIIGIDVTGSMQNVICEVMRKIGPMMQNLTTRIKSQYNKDVEILFMGIGDLHSDVSPVQVGQFESDIRIPEQIENIWYEANGGSNVEESYTVAWYFGSRHTKLDCWNRGQKGIIITIGDERCPTSLPAKYGRNVGGLADVFGDDIKYDVDTPDLYYETLEKYDIYHVDIEHDSRWRVRDIARSWSFLEDRYIKTDVDHFVDKITDIITNAVRDGRTSADYAISRREEHTGW